MRAVAVTGIGLVSALPGNAETVAAALDAGASGLRVTTGLLAELPIPGVGVAEVDIRPRLRRRKDRKLLPRSAELALEAAAVALGEDIPADVALFLGVGREPGDQDEVERALVRSSRDGRLDAELLATAGLASYPPLAPLKTLPNMALAHVAIQLGLTGEGGTRAGEEAAGLAALIEGYWAVAEGRAEVAIAGGADSRVDAGAARDMVRLGRAGPERAPGEGAGVLRLEPVERARARGAAVLAVIDGGGLGFEHLGAPVPALPWESRWGACGAAAGPMAVVVAIAAGRRGRLDAAEASGSTAWIAWSVPRAC